MIKGGTVLVLVAALVLGNSGSEAVGELSADLSNTVVRIQNLTKGTQGTGVVIGLAGQQVLILTAGHVVEDEPHPVVRNATGSFAPYRENVTIRASVERLDLDIALVQIDYRRVLPRDLSLLRFADDAITGDGMVEVVGFPVGIGLGRPRVARGRVFGPGQMIEPLAVGEDGVRLRGGLSGGPVVLNGRLAGIYVGRSTEVATQLKGERKARMVPGKRISDYIARTEFADRVGFTPPIPGSPGEDTRYLQASLDLVAKAGQFTRQKKTDVALLMLAQARALALRAGVWQQIKELFVSEVQALGREPFVYQEVLGREHKLNRILATNAGIVIVGRGGNHQYLSLTAAGRVIIEKLAEGTSTAFPFSPDKIFGLDAGDNFLVSDGPRLFECTGVRCREILGHGLSKPDSWTDFRRVGEGWAVLMSDSQGFTEYLVEGGAGARAFQRYDLAWPGHGKDKTDRCTFHSAKVAKYSGDGKVIIGVSDRGLLNVYERETGRLLNAYSLRDPSCRERFSEENRVTSITFSDSVEDIIVSFHDTQIVKVMFGREWSAGPDITEIRGRCGYVTEFRRGCAPSAVSDLSSDGRLLAVGTHELPGRVTLYDLVGTPKVLFESQDAHTSYVAGIAFVGGERELVTYGDGGGSAEKKARVVIWRPQDEPTVFQAVADRARTITFDPSGRVLLVAGHNRPVVELFDPMSGRKLGETEMRLGEARSVWQIVAEKKGERHSFSPVFAGDVTTIVSGSIFGRVGVWKARRTDEGMLAQDYRATSVVQVPSRDGSSGDPPAMRRSTVVRGNSQVVFCDGDGDVHAFDLDIRDSTVSGHERIGRIIYGCEGLGAVGDGEGIVAGGGSVGVLFRWSAESGGYEGIELDTSELGNIAAIAAGGRGYIAVGGDNGAVGVYDARGVVANALRALKPLNTMIGVTSSVEALAFDAKGGLLAVAGREPMIRVYDVAVPERPYLVRELVVEEVEGAGAIAFSPTGPMLAAVGHDGGRVSVWRLEDLERRPCDLALRNFELTEWNAYVGSWMLQLQYERTCPQLPSGHGAPKDARPAWVER